MVNGVGNLAFGPANTPGANPLVPQFAPLGFPQPGSGLPQQPAAQPGFGGATNLPQTPGFNVGNFNIPGSTLGNIQGNIGSATQQATNVIDVQPQLSSAVSQFGNLANQAISQAPSVNLGTGFAGPESFQQLLEGGIDPFGQRVVSEGLQNIGLQREAQNRALQSSLGRSGQNQNLINVLQNQNLFRSQLGLTPLLAEAQRGTAERVGQQIQLQNLQQQLENQAQLQQAGFNQQSFLASLQPFQNQLELLSALQGQGRGVTATQAELGARNFD